MPYVNVPNDLSKIKTKVAFNLTKRQILCFGGAAAVGVPVYLMARSAIGNSAAMFVMIALMLPFFCVAMYERDGLPFEKVAWNIIRARFVRPGPRPYKTENFYAILNKEDLTLDTDKTKTAAAKRGAQKRRAAHGATDHPLRGNATGRHLQSAGRVLHKDDRV